MPVVEEGLAFDGCLQSVDELLGAHGSLHGVETSVVRESAHQAEVLSHVVCQALGRAELGHEFFPTHNDGLIHVADIHSVLLLDVAAQRHFTAVSLLEEHQLVLVQTDGRLVSGPDLHVVVGDGDGAGRVEVVPAHLLEADLVEAATQDHIVDVDGLRVVVREADAVLEADLDGNARLRVAATQSAFAVPLTVQIHDHS
ncbi:hypothetical protein WR25_11624 [Diploscapter pachys]|uniref:Uncharacterized protein n=1 Tax=Diploscapter pachys TaxID=2018661 RepID=A0A2A2KRA9_9BILA|nr:hypothetical protein WR25_11624 [Diploscapter pachys]